MAILPHNTLEYAEAAQQGGADAMILGIDKTESVFPGLFGSFDLQEDSILGIVSTSSIPVGLSIGDSSTADARRLGTDNQQAVQLREHVRSPHAAPFVLSDGRIDKLVSIGAGYMVEQIKSLSEMDQVKALEAAIVSPQGATHVFSVLDLSTLTDDLEALDQARNPAGSEEARAGRLRRGSPKRVSEG